MTKTERFGEADFFRRSGRGPQSTCEAGVWKTRVRGKAVCANVDCQGNTGTIDGEPRFYEDSGKRIINRAFDYTAAEIEKRVKNGMAVYCTDKACQLAQSRASAKRRRASRKSKAVAKTARAGSR